MSACPEFDLLLSLHAASALDPAEAARVEEHLALCPACRAEAAADREALSLAKLPLPSERERRALELVPRRALASLQRSDRRRAGWRKVAVAVALAAAALLAVLLPSALRRPPELPAVAVAAAARWEAPDLDAVWEDTAVLDLEGSVNSYEASDAALAALDL